MNAYWMKKLVRDASADNMRAAGAFVAARTLTVDEFPAKIAEKLGEELDEFRTAQTPAAQAEELADILELIDAYLAARNMSFDDIRQIQAQKRKARGGFDARAFVEYIETPKGSTYDAYCAASPEKYPVKNG